ncbi:TetR/AcrR family transcriptional regulator [Microbacterium sp. 18062]|uniref:TetR/AcrR family transcriptional regulator n=1 Tax=Microbacterium sp. 18062 TaxID=2681410 RepID=UPI001F4900CB|nr:TetR-like C-terminal domain-containing protein [Microbacterium sp. 18062]
MRELARRSGVSHSAPVHHFGTRQGLLTALAAEGFAGLNEALSAHTDDLGEMGVAYVTWALAHPGHDAVMWRPRLLNDSSEELALARQRAWTLLSTTATDDAADSSDAKADSYAAFAIVHGPASLWLTDALPLPEDPVVLVRQITQRLATG